MYHFEIPRACLSREVKQESVFAMLPAMKAIFQKFTNNSKMAAFNFFFFVIYTIMIVFVPRLLCLDHQMLLGVTDITWSAC